VRRAFPDLRIDVQDVIVEGDKVVTEEKMTGTHTGPYRSSSTGLTVGATGREVTWTRLAVRTLRDDRFVDGFWEEDEVSLLQQLGILQTPAAGSE
jgi:predicted ester cyclase